MGLNSAMNATKRKPPDKPNDEILDGAVERTLIKSDGITIRA